MSEKISVVVTVGLKAVDPFSAVVHRLEEAGLEVDQTLETVRLVTGSVPEEALERVEGVEGVLAVERLREFHIAPPESEVQ